MTSRKLKQKEAAAALGLGLEPVEQKLVKVVRRRASEVTELDLEEASAQAAIEREVIARELGVQRLPTEGADVPPEEDEMACSICGEKGHNRSSCVRLKNAVEAPEMPEEEAYSEDGAVPPPSIDPALRDKPSIGAMKMLEEVEDQSDGRLRSLEDLVSRFPLNGLGDFFIRVERIQPKVWHGIPCAGQLRPIKDSLDYNGFVARYGGGRYVLQVYGPPKRQGRLDPATRRLVPKALTSAVDFTVPWGDGYGHAPNPDAAELDLDDQETTMNDGQMMLRMPRHAASVGDAKIAEAQLAHEEKKMERDLRLQQERETSATARARAEAEVEKRRIDAEAEREARAAEIADKAREREAERNDRLTQMLLEQRNGGGTSQNELARAHEQHKREVTDLVERHRRELETLRETLTRDLERERQVYAREIEREKERAAQQIELQEKNRRLDVERLERQQQDLVTRAETRARDAEAAARERVREVEEKLEKAQRLADERLDKELAAVRREHQRELEAKESIWRMQMDQARSSNEKDERRQKETFDLVLHQERSTFETQLKLKEGEVGRLTAENERLRSELAEKGDIVTQLHRARELKEQLAELTGDGEEKETPPGDWKSMVPGLLGGLVQQLPQIVQSAGNAVAQTRAASAMQANAAAAAAQPAVAGGAAAPQLPNGRPRPMQRLVFDVDDGSSGPVRRSGIPMDVPAPPPLETMAAAPMVVAPAPVVETWGEAVPQPAPVPTPSAPPPPQAAAPAPAEPAAEDEPQGLDIPDEQILQFREWFEQAFKEGRTPKEFVDGLVSQIGGPGMRQMGKALPPERVIAVLEKHAQTSPLLEPAGKQWLRKVGRAIDALA